MTLGQDRADRSYVARVQQTDDLVDAVVGDRPRRRVRHLRGRGPLRPDTTAGAGAFSTFSLLGSPGADDRWTEIGDGDGIPGTAAAGQHLGSSNHCTGTNLYVGLPHGPSIHGTLYALPLSNVTAGGTVKVFRPYHRADGPAGSPVTQCPSEF